MDAYFNLGLLRFQHEHLKKLQECLQEELNPDEASGKNCQSFATELKDVDLSALPKGQLKHSDVFTLATSIVNVTTVCAAIMAWGGMRYNHRNLLFAM